MAVFIVIIYGSIVRLFCSQWHDRHAQSQRIDVINRIVIVVVVARADVDAVDATRRQSVHGPACAAALLQAGK